MTKTVAAVALAAAIAVGCRIDGERFPELPDGGSGGGGGDICDADSDGYRVPSCGGDDCNDRDATRHPGAVDACDDHVDQDCDGVDAGCPCQPGDVRRCWPLGPDDWRYGTGPCREGLQVCANNGIGFGPCEGMVLPVDEAPECDGIDSDCDGDADGGLVNACGTCGEAPVEICGNGLDDDCDGVIDPLEQCPVTCDGCRVQACYGGPPQTLGVGICHAGKSVCTDGDSFGPCLGDQQPRPEVCGNGLDDDCNGWVDEKDGATGTSCSGVDCGAGAQELCDDQQDNDCDGFVDETCLATADEQPCYAGPPGSLGVGACHAGVQQRRGMYWGPCVDEVVPQHERCGDGIDSDCDGFGGPDSDEEDAGCCVPTEEVCNSLDDDCDGYIDDGVSNLCGTCNP